MPVPLPEACQQTLADLCANLPMHMHGSVREVALWSAVSVWARENYRGGPVGELECSEAAQMLTAARKNLRGEGGRRTLAHARAVQERWVEAGCPGIDAAASRTLTYARKIIKDREAAAARLSAKYARPNKRYAKRELN